MTFHSQALVNQTFVTPEEIVIPPRLRSGLNEESVASLVQSIKQIGLRTPLTVREDKDEDGELTVVLVAGRHRLEACKRLGMELVDCIIFKGTETEARLWEIAENLHRADLTAVERADHIAEWIKLAEKETEGVSAQNDHKLSTRGRKGEGRPEGGISAAARHLGIDRNEARRAITIAALPDEVRQKAREEDWSQTKLLNATKPIPPPRDARNDLEVVNKQADKILHAWNDACREARELFLEKIDRLAFDDTRATKVAR